MAEAVETCSCGAVLPAFEGPVHRYMLSTPSCWEAYGRVLASEYEDPARWQVHRLTVDAYAAQHPGVDGPQARNSVGIHLSRLSLVFERGLPPELSNEAMVKITARKQQYPWLTPPRGMAEFTVIDVLAANGPEAHMAAVRKWARAVWDSWSEHHATIREWLRQVE